MPVLVSELAVTVTQWASIAVALFVRLTTTDWAPVGTPEPRNHALQSPGSPAVSVARPAETAVSEAPP